MMEFGLLGKKLGHSFSRGYFTNKFREGKIDAIYENFELADITEFPALCAAHPNLRGLNVTVPYKEAVIPYLDELSENAAAVGAVNTILFEGGRKIGHNTDIIGFRDALAAVYTGAPGGDALILGTGGSAKAVRFVLTHFFEFDHIQNASRYPKGDEKISYEALEVQGLAPYRLLVNCTPVGMAPQDKERIPLPYATLDKSCLVYDLIYNPAETRLLAAAKKHGCPTANGLDMLIRQAEASWEIWMG
ncbi:MAG: shikimate dehydrogenase [Bacteroidota bacterium]